MKDLFIYPTDTVWGIGGDPFVIETYESIAQLKGTSIRKPLSILTNDVQNLINCFHSSDSYSTLFDDLFQFEITIGLPKVSLSLKFPEGPFDETDFICFRVIQNEIIDECIKSFPGFITSTSLNKTGQPPISDTQEANDFWHRYCPESNFISSEFLRPSGHSSSIILISGLTAQIVREGNHIEEILKVLKSHGINY